MAAPDRRDVLLALAGATLAAPTLTGHAAAQGSGLEIIAPAGPGGGYDQLARAVAEGLQSQNLMGSARVTNVPGAGGTIGLAQFVASRKTSASLLVAGLGLVGAVIVNKAPVDLGQTAAFARLTGEYQPLVVPDASPLTTLDDLAAAFSRDPGAVSWGGFALGSPDHMLSALTVKAFGGDVARMNYIPVGAGGEMLPLIMGGRLTVATGGLSEFAQQIKGGALRALALSAPERLPGVDIPTFREQGRDVELSNWRGLMAPKGLDATLSGQIGYAVGKLTKSAGWRNLLAQRSWVDLYQPAEVFAPFVASEQARVAALLRNVGLF